MTASVLRLRMIVNSLENGEIAFWKTCAINAEEEKNDAGFVAELAKLGDIYVNDAFHAPIAPTPRPKDWRMYCRHMPGV